LTRNPGDPGFRLTRFSKEIGTKPKFFLILIFNAKAKILIKKLNWTKPEKKKEALGSMCFFSFKMNGKSYRKWKKTKKTFNDETKKKLAKKQGKTRQIRVNFLNSGQSFKATNH
jgi:hypothetical protein